MEKEIINSLRAKSTIRLVGTGNTVITLSDLSANTSVETVTEAAVAQVSCCTNGVWKVYRGDNSTGTLLLELTTYAHFVLYEFDVTFANGATSNVYIENTGANGTFIMQMAKTATYNPPLTGM
jgi:VCBS repeat-containing protein